VTPRSLAVGIIRFASTAGRSAPDDSGSSSFRCGNGERPLFAVGNQGNRSAVIPRLIRYSRTAARVACQTDVVFHCGPLIAMTFQYETESDAVAAGDVGVQCIARRGSQFGAVQREEDVVNAIREIVIDGRALDGYACLVRGFPPGPLASAW